MYTNIAQNGIVKRMGSLEKLKAIAWGHSGDRVRSRPGNREGWLSVEDQVRTQATQPTQDVLIVLLFFRRKYRHQREAARPRRRLRFCVVLFYSDCHMRVWGILHPVIISRVGLPGECCLSVKYQVRGLWASQQADTNWFLVSGYFFIIPLCPICLLFPRRRYVGVF